MKTAALIICVLASGCIDDETSTDELDGGDEDVEVLPKLATNALTPAQLLGASLNYSPLSQAMLNTYAGNANARASLVYAIGCALPAGVNVTGTYNQGGSLYSVTWQGEIGLASGWRTSSLTTSQQQLVSACVLARVNLTGASVMVSLRGPSSGLSVTPAESTAYLKQEGGFFGNIFQGPGFHLAACKGSLAVAPANRRCAQPTNTLQNVTECGFSYAGACAAVCTGGTYFTGCLAKNGTRYAEAVSSFLK